MSHTPIIAQDVTCLGSEREVKDWELGLALVEKSYQSRTRKAERG